MTTKFLDKHFFFRTKFFFRPKFFFYQICLQQKNLFCGLKFCGPTFFLDQHLFWTSFFSDQNLLGSNKFEGVGSKILRAKIWVYSSLIYMKPKYRILAPYEAQNPSKIFRQVVGGGGAAQEGNMLSTVSLVSVLLWSKALVSDLRHG